MQAQLLSTIPSRAIEIGDGHAANDDTVEIAQFVEARPALSLQPVSTQRNERMAVGQSNDDYWLGGYAGI